MFTKTQRFQSMSQVAGMLGVLLAGPLAFGSPAQTTGTPPEAKKVSQVVIAGIGPESYSKSFLGVGVQEIDADRAREKNLKEVRGVEITSVASDSAADKAGLKKGDVVLEYNGVRVEGCAQFQRLVSETPVRRQATLKIARDGSEQTLTATMGSKKEMAGLWAKHGEQAFHMPEIAIPQIRIPDVPHVFTTWRTAKLGIIGESLEGQLAEFFGVKEGVLVRSVTEGSPAAKAGLQAGDVVIEIGSTKVTAPREITGAIREMNSDTFSIKIMRNRQQMTLNVTIEREPGNGNLRRLVFQRGVPL